MGQRGAEALMILLITPVLDEASNEQQKAAEVLVFEFVYMITDFREGTVTKDL